MAKGGAVSAPPPSLAARALLRLLRGYQLLLSPWLGGQCRFQPSCSQYSMEAVRRHGALKGTGLSLRRLLRCHPWCAGGDDPVPR